MDGRPGWWQRGFIGGQFALVSSPRRDNRTPTPSIRTRTASSRPSPCSRTARSWLAARSPTSEGKPRSHRPTRRDYRSADSFDPNATARSIQLPYSQPAKFWPAPVHDHGGQFELYWRLDATSGAADSFNLLAPMSGRSPCSLTAKFWLVALPPHRGQTRLRLARLDATTGAADSFDPSANGTVESIALQPDGADGKIVVGGIFTTMSGQIRNNAAALRASRRAAVSSRSGHKRRGRGITNAVVTLVDPEEFRERY